MKPFRGADGTRISGYALIDMRTGAVTEQETVAQFPSPGGKGATIVVHSKLEIQVGKKK